MSENIVDQIKAEFKRAPTQLKILNLLSDGKWHCRKCEGEQLIDDQYVHRGIQALKRGNSNRPGLVIEKSSMYCNNCKAITPQDRWTGEIKSVNIAAKIPDFLARRILKVYFYTDVIEQRPRAASELVIDHRFPRERWRANEPLHLTSLSESEIKRKFQLLKRDGFDDLKLLKSRACENCIRTGKRGTPFGIRFWYEGGEDWPSVHQQGAEAESGCVGCCWYNFEAWRDALNQKLASSERDG